MLSRIHAYLREAPRQFREMVRIGPFLATFTDGNDNPYINYAIPDDYSNPTVADVRELIAAYESRLRKPRLEYIPDICPLVEPALLNAGFDVERRTPLMYAPPDQESPLFVPAGFELVAPTSDADFQGLVSALYEAYGEPPPGTDDIARTKSFVEKGGMSILAREVATGEAAGGGSCTVPVDGVTEVAGIGVREQFRRLGLGQAITVRLTQDAIQSGVTFPFLMAATETEARIYARAGFQSIGSVLHISRPTPKNA